MMLSLGEHRFAASFISNGIPCAGFYTMLNLLHITHMNIIQLNLRNLRIIALTLFSSLAMNGQTHEFRVYLKDKGTSRLLMSTPEQFLSPGALQRRAQQDIPLNASDLPIATEYKFKLEEMGAKVLAQSKWLNYLYVSHPQPELISSLPFVARIEYPRNYQCQLSSMGSGDTLEYGFARGQVEMLNGHLLHQRGFTGSGINIAVIDAGYGGLNLSNALDSLRKSSRLKGSYNFISGDTNVFNGWGDHGTGVLSVMAAHLPDTIIGTAPHANYWLLTTENINYESPVEMDYWVMAAEFADSAGVHLINTSLSYRTFDNPQDDYSYSDMDGNTTVITKAADLAASKGILVVASAGNTGDDPEPHIAAPADGDSVLTVGAVSWQGSYASFSSVGPSADGRVKPDVMAQGSPATMVNGLGQVDIDFGTSYAAPIVAGLAACLLEAYPARHSEEVASFIRQSAHLHANPNDSMGFGIPDFEQAFILSEPRFLVSKADYEIYPNPGRESFYFRNNSNQAASVYLTDLNGKELGRYEVNGKSEQRINASSLIPGIYILHMDDGSSFKLIIQ